MPQTNSILLRRGTAASWTSVNPTLNSGEAGFESDSNRLKIGNGSVSWQSLNYIGVAGSYDVDILALGTITGSNAINCAQNKQFQTLTLNGTATTLTKGTGWPSANGTLRDVTLLITVSSPTSVTWTIINDWYRQPDSPLPTGSHMILLRAISSTTIQGHYLGNKTN
jgi:hypothetical protein